MATTFLTLTNNVLKAINEPNLTSTTFPTSVGIQLTVQNDVNQAIKDIIGAELEWPFNYATRSDTLIPATGTIALQTNRTVDWDSFYIQPINEVTNGEFTSNITSWTSINAGSGAAAYTSTGNGRARLTGDGTDIGGITQSISTVINREYRALFRHLSNAVTVRVGTTSGGIEISSTEYALGDDGEGELKEFSFTATATATYISFTNTSATAVDIDFIRIRENREGQKLSFKSLDTWRELQQGQDNVPSTSQMGYPSFVYETQNDYYGITPLPNQGNWEISYDYWTIPAELTVHGSAMVIPDQWAWVVVEQAKMYAFEHLSDPSFHDRSQMKASQGIKRMRIEMINRKDEMTSRMNARSGRHNSIFSS